MEITLIPMMRINIYWHDKGRWKKWTSVPLDGAITDSYMPKQLNTVPYDT